VSWAASVQGTGYIGGRRVVVSGGGVSHELDIPLSRFRELVGRARVEVYEGGVRVGRVVFAVE